MSEVSVQNVGNYMTWNTSLSWKHTAPACDHKIDGKKYLAVFNHKAAKLMGCSLIKFLTSITNINLNSRRYVQRRYDSPNPLFPYTPFTTK